MGMIRLANIVGRVQRWLAVLVRTTDSTLVRCSALAAWVPARAFFLFLYWCLDVDNRLKEVRT